MNPQPSHRPEGILAAALEHAPEDREGFIDRACGDDPDLRAELRVMLAAHEATVSGHLAGAAEDDAPGRNLEATAKLVPGAAPSSRMVAERDCVQSHLLAVSSMVRGGVECEGDLIGRYKLLQELGEGGFGTVWMAEQVEPVTRRVALKIIKLGMDTKVIIARFEAERQALAMMDHPNIAKVLDAGATDMGRPFFVMELVKGLPITRYCDEAGLGTRERLALFADVCSAIQHAHQKGVIHRDIKPSNVMVTMHGDKAVVKVIDFGIAKATQGKLTDKTLFTRFEQFVGTPVYMSPEQASLSGLDIDTRSDIYGLGILLYELLTGKPPFDAKTLASAGYDEMRRIIREVEPPKPSSRISTMGGEERTALAKARQVDPEHISRLVEPDLDWIVMKAIEKDRALRYETANGLARDIQRFLDEEPVSARPPSASYKFRKFARRNKAALRAAALIVVLMVAATIFSSWQAVRATKAERLANDSLVLVGAERDAKEAARKAAESESLRATAAEKLAKDRLTEIAAERDAKDRAHRDAVAVSNFLVDIFQSPQASRDGHAVTVAEMLDGAVKKLESEFAGSPAQRARLQTTLSDTYFALGLHNKAISLQEMVRDFHLATSGRENSHTIDAMAHLAYFYETAGRADEARKLREEVVALRRATLGADDPQTLIAMNALSKSYTSGGRKHEALKLSEEAITRMEELLERRRSELGPEHLETLRTMKRLADTYSTAGRKHDAIKLFEEVLELRRKVLGAKDADTLSSMRNLALIYSANGRNEDAIKLYEEMLPLCREVHGAENPNTLGTMTNLATSYWAAGRREEARKLREELLPLCRKTYGPEHPLTLGIMFAVAGSSSDPDRADEMIKVREDEVQLTRKTMGPEHPGTITAMHILANQYAKTRPDDEIKLREEILPLSRKVLGSDATVTYWNMVNLARCYRNKGEVEKAAALEKEIDAAKRRANSQLPAGK